MVFNWLRNSVAQLKKIIRTRQLNQKAFQLYNIGQYKQAVILAEELLQLARELWGDEHPDVATSLNNLAGLYKSMGRYCEAEPLYVEALGMRKRLLGPEHPDVASSLNNLAGLYKSIGRYCEAEPLLVEALGMRKRLLGDEHPDVASSLNNLAALYESIGRYCEAEPLLVEALAMRKRLLGDEHPDVASSLNNLAALYESIGRYCEAEPLYVEALGMSKRLLGPEHPNVASSLNNLAALYESIGRYCEAEPLLVEALAMRKRLLGDEHPDVASSLNNLAGLYKSIGRYCEAEPLYVEALGMSKRLLGDEHPNVASSLNNLAGLYKSIGRYCEAEPLYVEALGMSKRLLGDEHPNVASSLNNLAALYESIGRYCEAEPLYLEALGMRKRLLGDEHPDVATSLNNLAGLYQSIGRYGEAEPLLVEALAINKRLLGPEHPDVATSLNNLAGLFAATNRQNEALAKMKAAMKIDDGMIQQIFTISSESDRLSYLQTIRNHFYGFLSLVWGHFSNSQEAKQEALDLVLRRKSLTATALAAQNQAIYSGNYPHLEAEFKQLQSLSNQIAHLSWSQPLPEERTAYQQQLGQLQAEHNQLQKKLASQVPEIQLQEQQANRHTVASALPAGSILVEYVRFDAVDFHAPRESRWQPARYLAFILPAGQPEQIEMIDLGEAENIDRLISVLRQSASTQPQTLVSLDMGEDDEDQSEDEEDSAFLKYKSSPEAIELSKVIFDKILPYLNSHQNLIIAPDGDLNLLPFQILPLNTTGEELLIDKYNISYLSSGRDILRSRISTKRPASAPMIIADPDFNLAGEISKQTRRRGDAETRRIEIPRKISFTQAKETEKLGAVATLAPDLLNTLAAETFSPAPGTRILGERVAAKLGVKPYLGADALESHLLNCQSPSILLIATHGYFSKEIQLQDYLNLILVLLKCPSEQEAEILQKNQKLIDQNLLEIMEIVATLLEEKHQDQDQANWFRNFAAQLATTINESSQQPPISNQNHPNFPYQGRNSKISNSEDPMLRSGLALAGANTRLSGKTLPPQAGKGLIFAQEIATLDLWENEISVLSACNTAMGDVKAGEGVFGMRRAFALAGAKTLIMSLWSVPDKATALLMDRFFNNLQQGLDRASALKEAQNYLRTVTVRELQQFSLGREILEEMISRGTVSGDDLDNQAENRPLEHPFFWGAWICQGDKLSEG
ncbi:MAG: tetratricopeptide repeat protein [Symploca sp. SIO3C6]|nr:tetratricopeptide repeat protein [Symploca sp. SIO3C6]